MRTLLILLIGLCVTGFCGSSEPGEFHPFDGPAPLAVFIVTNPWAMVIGADTPRVAIYENGEFIFTRQTKDGGLHEHFMLDADRLAKLKELLEPVLAMKDLKLGYDMGFEATDLPEAQFYLRVGDRVVATSVYGLGSSGAKPVPRTAATGEVNPNLPPAELLALHSWLCAFDTPDATEWSPPYVEVMFWDDSNATDAPVAWPESWPSLTSDRAVKRGNDWSIFLDGSQLPRLRAFFAAKKPNGAVEIGGKKMAMSYRFTFPGEPIWRNALIYGTHPPAKVTNKVDH
jgi:hypothetical protein